MKTPNHICAEVEVLRAAVAVLRDLGVEILSASAYGYSPADIHVVDPGPIPKDSHYTRCVLDGRQHLAVPFMGCQVVWIEPPVVPGAEPTTFPSLTERTAEHG